jgi:hypothetical protein
MRNAIILIAVTVLATGCVRSNDAAAPSAEAVEAPSALPPANVAARPAASIENVIWFQEGADAPLGAIEVFASDGALLFDSCYETFRIARWRRIDDDAIAWVEDAAEITADILEVTASSLTLTLHLKNETITRVFSRRDGEYLCPSIR